MLMLFLAGCAATIQLAPTSLDEATKQFPPLTEQAELYLVRLPQHLGTRTIFALHVDGVMVGGLPLARISSARSSPARTPSMP
jgi:hypothetical protein